MENSHLLSARLQWCIDHKHELDPNGAPVTRTKLASIAGRSRAAVTYWFQDVNGLDAEAARKLGDFFRVNPVWLETGEGSPDTVAAPLRSGETAGRLGGEDLLRHAVDLLSVYSQADDRERRHIDGAIADVREMQTKRAAVNQR